MLSKICAQIFDYASDILKYKYMFHIDCNNRKKEKLQQTEKRHYFGLRHIQHTKISFPHQKFRERECF